MRCTLFFIFKDEKSRAESQYMQQDHDQGWEKSTSLLVMMSVSAWGRVKCLTCSCIINYKWKSQEFSNSTLMQI